MHTAKPLNNCILKFQFCVLGMPLPSENALRVKVGLLPHRKFVVKKDTDDDEDDETWKPSNPKTTKSFLLSNKL